MKKQKTVNSDYMKIVEINENRDLFKTFLSEEHSDVECKDFCLKMIAKCPGLKKYIDLDENRKFNQSTVKAMYSLYGKDIEYTYNCSGIEKQLKPKKNFIDEADTFIKRKTIEAKNVFIKSLILIVSAVLFWCSFKVKDVAWNSIFLAIATGLLSTLIFNWLTKIREEHQAKRKKEINRIISRCKIIKNDFAETKENYLANENDQMIFLDFIMSYKRLYDYIQDLKSKISLNTMPLQIDVKAFECYYQDKIEKEIQKCDDNFSELKNIYLENKDNYKEIILKPYALAIELIDNIIGLYVVDFGFLKQKEEGKNG